MLTGNGLTLSEIGNTYGNYGNFISDTHSKFGQTLPIIPVYNNFTSIGILSSNIWNSITQPLQYNTFPYNIYSNNIFSCRNFLNTGTFDFSTANKTLTNSSQCNSYNLNSCKFFNVPTGLNLTIPKSNKADRIFSQSLQKDYKHWYDMTDGEIYNIYGRYTRSLTKKYNGDEIKLNKYLEGKGVLQNQGKEFMAAQEKYGISASVLVAICIHESGNGNSSNAKNKNNVGGIRDGANGFRTFKSVPECIDYMANLLKKHYIDNPRSLNNLALVNAKYCPITDKSGSIKGQSSWASKIDMFAREVEQQV